MSTEETLTDEQVLSLLNRMDAEQRTFDQLNTARRHVGSVIIRFKEVSGLLPGLEDELARLKSDIGNIDNQIASKKKKGENEILDAHEQLKAALESEITPLKEEVVKAREDAADARKDKEDAEAVASSRISELNSQIIEKEDELARVTKAFNDFKFAHGLGS